MTTNDWNHGNTSEGNKILGPSHAMRAIVEHLREADEHVIAIVDPESEVETRRLQEQQKVMSSMPMR